MNKRSSITLVLVLFLLYLIPLVNATSETFTLAKNEVKNIPIDLKQGDHVTGHITSLGSINATEPNWHQSLIIFKIIDPEGNSVDIFNSYWDVALSDSGFSFTAESTGTYNFQVANSVFPNKNQSIALNYYVTPKYGIALPSRLEGLLDQLSIYGPIILIIFSGVAASVSFILRARANAERIKTGANPSAALENNDDSETAAIHNDTPTSEEGRKKGILLQCRNAWLSNMDFYYCRNFFKVPDMVEALVDKNGSLAIRFNDGKTRKFKLAPNETEMASMDWNRNLVGSFVLTNRFMKKRSEKWAATINELISRQTRSTQTLG